MIKKTFYHENRYFVMKTPLIPNTQLVNRLLFFDYTRGY